MLNPNVFPHLKGEQCEVLYLPRFSNQIVLGVAGSGKSLEAIYRSTWISMSDPNEKMVILTFNHDISEDIKKKMKYFTDGKNLNVEVNSIYTYCKQLLNTCKPKAKSKLEQVIKDHNLNQDTLTASTSAKDNIFLNEIIDSYKEQNPDSTIWNKNKDNSFIEDEINWMMDNEIPYDNQDKYLQAPRTGRGVANQVSVQQRNAIYDIYQAFYNLRLSHGKLFSYKDIYRLIPDLSIPEEQRPKYIIIDEVQDLSKSMFTALRSIKKSNGFWNVFGDINQNIFGQQISWKEELGIRIPKIQRFQFNYRNNYEIGKFNEQLLSAIYNLQEEIHQEEKSGPKPVKTQPILDDVHGNKPYLTQVNNETLINEIKTLSDNGNLLIICMNSKSNNEVTDLLKSYNIIVYNNFDNYSKDNQKNDKILVQTINRVKGLEFNNVIIYGIDEINPLSDRSAIKQENSRLINQDLLNNNDKLRIANRLYVAASRARNNLLMFYKEHPLNFLQSEVNYYEQQ